MKVSKTGLLAAVKELRWREVADGLAEKPELLRFRDHKGRSWLHLCCSIDVRKRTGLAAKDSVRLAELLLARGLGIDDAAFREGAWQATPLWYSIAWGRNLPLATFLLKRGADPNHCMFAAAFNDDVAAIRLLAQHRADIDPGIETPFLFAIRWSRFAAAEALLKLGANVDTQDKKKRTALHYMLKKGSDLKHFRFVIAHGARGDLQDCDGVTAAEVMKRKKDPAFRALAAELASPA